MIIADIAGIIAVITSMIGLLPQVYKAIRTRSTADVSMVMLINFLICSVAWIIYGGYTNSFFVELSNVCGLLSCLILICLKAFYDKRVIHD